MKMTKKERLTIKAREILEATPAGTRFSELVGQLQNAFPDDPYGTITGTVWNLDAQYPDEIYKPSRGLFRLRKFQIEALTPVPEAEVTVAPPSHVDEPIRESDFYEPFADYLVRGLEECTVAVPLGGNRFGSKWGTPGVYLSGKGERHCQDAARGDCSRNQD